MREDMKVPDISAEQLRPVVVRALGSSDATPLAWSCEPLGVDLVNPITAGLYRVAGTAEVDAARVRPWQVILKVSHHPDFAGTPLEHGYAEHPEDWNYWRREVLAYRSGIPDRFRSPLRPVQCWSAEDVDETTAWLWLEDLEVTTDGPRWSLDDLAASAYDWGAFWRRVSPWSVRSSPSRGHCDFCVVGSGPPAASARTTPPFTTAAGTTLCCENGCRGRHMLRMPR